MYSNDKKNLFFQPIRMIQHYDTITASCEY